MKSLATCSKTSSLTRTTCCCWARTVWRFLIKIWGWILWLKIQRFSRHSRDVWWRAFLSTARCSVWTSSSSSSFLALARCHAMKTRWVDVEEFTRWWFSACVRISSHDDDLPRFNAPNYVYDFQRNISPLAVNCNVGKSGKSKENWRFHNSL